MSEECTDCPYQDIHDIRPLLFKDRFYTIPAIEETRRFMEHMLTYHPDDLKFLHNKSQQYVNIKGSQYRMDFKKWLRRAERNLNKGKTNG